MDIADRLKKCGLDQQKLDSGPESEHIDEETSGLTARAIDRVALGLVREVRTVLSEERVKELRIDRFEELAGTARIEVPPESGRWVLQKLTADNLEGGIANILNKLTDEECSKLRLLK